eukprot:2387012-Lingulodinium_polyedra.AAC.1
MVDLFRKIHEKEFGPDSTRSGRWSPPQAAVAGSSGTTEEAKVDDKYSEDGSSSGSSDASDDLGVEEEAEAVEPDKVEKPEAFS